MFDFAALIIAASVDEAIAALAADPEAVIIAGGTDVLIKIREGELAGRRLVSIHDVSELRGVILDEEGTVHIGALTTFRGVTLSPIIHHCVPYLGFAADQAGGPQLRALGTIGGNVCNGVTSADSASTLMALDVVLRAKGPEGVRDIPISQWYQGVGKVALRHGELLTEILIPKSHYEGFSGHYIKYAQRNAMDIATLGVACLVKLSADQTRAEEVHLAFGVAGPIPMRAPTAEAGVAGLPVEEAIAKIGELALQDVKPRTSWRASKEFRIQLVKELSARALRQAVQNGGGTATC